MAKAKSSSQITAARLRRNEEIACAKLVRSARKLGAMRVLISDLEHSITAVNTAHSARLKFEGGKS